MKADLVESFGSGTEEVAIVASGAVTLSTAAVHGQGGTVQVHGTTRCGLIAVEYTGVDLHIGTTASINSSALEVSDAPQELERNFEIVLLIESARTELKSSANKR
jgi:hypothetical protein